MIQLVLTILLAHFNNVATITVYDLNTPKLSIQRTATAFAFADAELTLTSDIKPAGPIDVSVRVQNTAGNFYDLTNTSSQNL